MTRFEIYYGIYSRETQRRSTLNNSIGTPITLSSAAIGGIFFFLTTNKFGLNQFADIALCIFLGLAVLALIANFFYLVLFFNNGFKTYEDQELIYADEIESQYDAWKAHHENDAIKTKESFSNDFIQLLIQVATSFAKNNDQKAKHIYNSKQALIISIIFILAGSIPYGITYFRKSESIQKVEIVNISTPGGKFESVLLRIDSLEKTIGEIRNNKDEQSRTAKSKDPSPTSNSNETQTD